MARKVLEGTAEEQAAQLYDMAAEAMGEGRYSAATRYLAEIHRVFPNYRDVPALLLKAKHAKREQRFLLMSSLFGGMILIVLARVLGAEREWWFIGAGVAGLALGFIAGQLLFRLLTRPVEPGNH